MVVLELKEANTSLCQKRCRAVKSRKVESLDVGLDEVHCVDSFLLENFGQRSHSDDDTRRLSLCNRFVGQQMFDAGNSRRRIEFSLTDCIRHRLAAYRDAIVRRRGLHPLSELTPNLIGGLEGPEFNTLDALALAGIEQMGRPVPDIGADIDHLERLIPAARPAGELAMQRVFSTAFGVILSISAGMACLYRLTQATNFDQDNAPPV